MTMDDLLDVTDQMMAFLRGKREDLHVYTTMGGEYREFFNDREIAPHGGRTGTLYRRPVAPPNRDRGSPLCFAALAYLWGRKNAERTEAFKAPDPEIALYRHRRGLCRGTAADRRDIHRLLKIFHCFPQNLLH